MSNHLGNVLTVINDIKVPLNRSGYASHPFGVQLDERTVSAESYRYGFNGMEKDNDLKGNGNSYDFGARMYDSRLGRWLSRDKLERKKPSYSPYQSFKGNPIIFNDPDGNDEFLTVIINNKQTGRTATIQKLDAVSTKIMTDGKGHKYFHSNYYYDFETIVTITIDKDGKESRNITRRILYDNGTKDLDLAFGSENVRKNGFIKSKSDGFDWSFSLEGSGGRQKGGYNLTSKSGGASPTKYVSDNDAESRDIGDLLIALGFGNRSSTVPKAGQLSSGEAALELSDKVNGIVQESNSSTNSEEAQNSKGSGKPGEVTSRKVETDSGTVTITDSTTSEKNGGGEYIKVRLETKVEKRP